MKQRTKVSLRHRVVQYNSWAEIMSAQVQGAIFIRKPLLAATHSQSIRGACRLLCEKFVDAQMARVIGARCVPFNEHLMSFSGSPKRQG